SERRAGPRDARVRYRGHTPRTSRTSPPRDVPAPNRCPPVAPRAALRPPGLSYVRTSRCRRHRDADRRKPGCPRHWIAPRRDPPALPRLLSRRGDDPSLLPTSHGLVALAWLRHTRRNGLEPHPPGAWPPRWHRLAA